MLNDISVEILHGKLCVSVLWSLWEWGILNYARYVSAGKVDLPWWVVVSDGPLSHFHRAFFFQKCSGVARGGKLRGWLPPGRNSAPPSCPQMKLHFVQRSMENRHFESQSAPLLTPVLPLPPPLPPPHFEKSGYAPAEKYNYPYMFRDFVANMIWYTSLYLIKWFFF